MAERSSGFSARSVLTLTGGIVVYSSQTNAVLSPREREIVALVANGLGNKAIARDLGISKFTVASHLRRVFAKLNVHSRAQMVAAVIDSAPDDPTMPDQIWRTAVPCVGAGLQRYSMRRSVRVYDGRLPGSQSVE